MDLSLNSMHANSSNSMIIYVYRTLEYKIALYFLVLNQMILHENIEFKAKSQNSCHQSSWHFDGMNFYGIKVPSKDNPF